MDKRKMRRNRKNAIEETMNMVKTIVLVVIAVVLVVFVFAFIRKTFGTGASESSDGDSKISSIFGNLLGGKETQATEELPSETVEDVEVDTDLKEGLNTDKNGRTVYVKDGVSVKDCWLDIDKALYRFGADGYAITGDYVEDAYVYTFSQGGKLQAIRRNENYTDPLKDGEYPSLVTGGDYKFWLAKENEAGEDMLGRFRAIKYKKGATHYLGGEGNKQYTLPGTLQADAEGYIYWLPLTDSPD